MGSVIEINDTLQLTREQGFPKVLNLAKHQQEPFKTSDFKGRVFEFKDKSDIRAYQQPPVRNFLVENVKGKWIYWGLVHVLEVRHDYKKQTTSGKFKVIHINSPEEMKKAHQLIDRRKQQQYFMR